MDINGNKWKLSLYIAVRSPELCWGQYGIVMGVYESWWGFMGSFMGIIGILMGFDGI
jgi:hypothetical protein